MNVRLAIYLGKGGTGKSTTSFALSSFLSFDRHVLAVDMDPQATLTNALLSEKPMYGVYEALTGTVAFEEAVVPAEAAYGPHLSVLAGTSALGALEQQTSNNLDRHYILRDLLDANKSEILTLIDCPPSGTSLLTVAALIAATHVLTPVSMDAASVEQLPAFERLFEQIRRRLNPGLKWLGILPTRFDSRRRLDNEVLEAVSQKHQMIFSPIIESVRVKESMATGTPANTGITKAIFEGAVAAILEEVERE